MAVRCYKLKNGNYSQTKTGWWSQGEYAAREALNFAFANFDVLERIQIWCKHERKPLTMDILQEELREKEKGQ